MNTTDTAVANAKPATVDAKSQLRKCRCECGGHVSGKSQYKQGHDAKHVSKLVEATKGIAAETDADEFGVAVANLSQKLGSGNLQTKYLNAVARWIYKQFDTDVYKASRKEGHVWAFGFHPDDVRFAVEGWTDRKLGEVKPRATKAEPVIEDAGTVKVGRWEYPARKLDGELQRNTRRNGEGDWIAA